MTEPAHVLIVDGEYEDIDMMHPSTCAYDIETIPDSELAIAVYHCLVGEEYGKNSLTDYVRHLFDPHVHPWDDRFALAPGTYWIRLDLREYGSRGWWDDDESDIIADVVPQPALPRA